MPDTQLTCSLYTRAWVYLACARAVEFSLLGSAAYCGWSWWVDRSGVYCGIGLERTIARLSWVLSGESCEPYADTGVNGCTSIFGDGDGFNELLLPCDPGEGNAGEDGIPSTPKIGVPENCCGLRLAVLGEASMR